MRQSKTSVKVRNRFAIFLIILMSISLACNLSGSESNEPQEPQMQITWDCPCATYDPQLQGTQECVCPAVVEATETPPPSCPQPGDTLYLYPEYDLTWENSDGYFNWNLPVGSDFITLQVFTNEETGSIEISNLDSTLFEYYGTMEGVDCVIDDGVGQTAFVVAGGCADGVVTLDITEHNEGWSGTLVCPDFTMPMDFEGGINTKTYDFPFPLDPAGSRVEQPYEGSSGAAAFTLAASQIEFPPVED